MLKKGDNVRIKLERKGSLPKDTLAVILDVNSPNSITWYWVSPLDERQQNGLMYPYTENELKLFGREEEEMFKNITKETENYVATEIAKLFAKDDPKGYAETRKQILRKKECNYFKKANNN